ncbi:MAG: right-handed parallel beta-helix repeat-containing protein [FCB group bacterium]|jgi:hypothetical protein|nr:right-handed parallel beta-helix repeat-containing protein [FCB group bacterium]
MLSRYSVNRKQRRSHCASYLDPFLHRQLLRLLAVCSLVIVSSACPARDAHQAPFDDHREYAGALPVFPGAEGYGAITPAGRGGNIVRVTTLASDGPGSLRNAVTQSGPKVIVFEVAGVIQQSTPLVLTEPFVTVAGQTAPSPGITLAGAGIVVKTHDVLIQHLRVRVGDDPQGPKPEGRDALGVTGIPAGTLEVYNVVIDHCSLSWGIDENASTWYAGVHDVTFRHCIISEGLSHSLHPKGEHSKGLLIGDHSRRVAVIGNLFAHNTERNPLIKGDVSALVANNLVYNPGRQAVHFSDPEGSGSSRAFIVGNVVIPGPDTAFSKSVHRVRFSTQPGTQVHAADNAILVDGSLSPIEAEDEAGTNPVTFAPLTLKPSVSVAEWVLANAGARPADRDAVDRRIVQDTRENTGRIIDSPGDIGGLPPVEPASRPLTMPDNPNADDNHDGYTNLENWLHAFAREVEPGESKKP